MTKTYFRALARTDVARPDNARDLAGGWCWFTDVEVLERNSAPYVVPSQDVPPSVLVKMTAPRADVAGLAMKHPNLMGILNVTPDSFSDGGMYQGADAALKQATAMIEAGANIIDVGGESTRPGAVTVPVDEEIARTAPTIETVFSSLACPISIDTRKHAVAQAALNAGAALINDVSGFTYDPRLAALAADKQVPVCVMHAQGDPATMQHDPVYSNVLLDVYDFLETQIERLEALGLSKGQIIVDPGIGFGKTLEHNLALLGRLSLFHSLGCAILLGASRKRFIGTISKTERADERVSGSVAVAQEAAAQGVQIIRVHDVLETRQALDLWQAVTTGEAHGA